MNERMLDWLDRLAQREREEGEPGYMEILPPLHAELGRRDGFQRPRASRAWASDFVVHGELQRV